MAHKINILTPHTNNPDGSQTATETPILALIEVDSAAYFTGYEPISATELGVDKLRSINVLNAFGRGIYNNLPAISYVGSALFSNGKPFPDNSSQATTFTLGFLVQVTDASGVDSKPITNFTQPCYALVLAT